MLKKLSILAAALAAAFALLMLAGRGATYTSARSLPLPVPPAEVWSLIEQVESWPRWWPGVRLASVTPGWAPGAQLVLELTGMPDQDPARVEEVNPGVEVRWSRPGFLGSETRTRLRIDPSEGGSLVTLESFIRGPQAFLAMTTRQEDFALYHQGVLESLARHLQGGEDAR